MKSNLLIGCVGDDFTGASDAASFLRSCGLRVVICTGIPDADVQLDEYDAIVIALKCRSNPAADAVRDCLEAFRYLLSLGAKQLYYKYCSTFDSTPKGNIGPVLDAVLTELNEPYTLLCPALPVNGRTVVNGSLFVDGVPVHQTSMKDHPLNPIWASEISELMRFQSAYPCYTLVEEDMQKGKEYVQNLLRGYAEKSPHFYVVPDYFKPEHNVLIYSLFGDLKLLSGGSGLLAAVNKNGTLIEAKTASVEKVGKTILLAGSCSQMTLKQINAYKESNPSIKIDPTLVLEGSQTVDSLWEEVDNRDAVLLYSSEAKEQQSIIPDALRPLLSEKLETLMAQLAYKALSAGYTQIIVAGGETSGAVIKNLGCCTYTIGESIAPGVPVMLPTSMPALRLVLKSGNFGKEDFFQTARDITCTGSRGL